VKSWSLNEIEAPGGTIDPAVLTTDDGTRAIAIRLEPGQELRDHQVRERAWVVVVEGEAQIRSGDHTVDGRTGTLVTFDPGERHAIASQGGARVLLILAPWPGPGHYPDTAAA
jgi:mannose-6-phosphate isomerase-like protein (cupin superfamily)